MKKKYRKVEELEVIFLMQLLKRLRLVTEPESNLAPIYNDFARVMTGIQSQSRIIRQSEPNVEDEETELLDSINRGLFKWGVKKKLSFDDGFDLLTSLQDEIIQHHTPAEKDWISRPVEWKENNLFSKDGREYLEAWYKKFATKLDKDDDFPSLDKPDHQ